jgi:hypothetical protein
VHVGCRGPMLAFVGSTLAYVGHPWCTLAVVGLRWSSWTFVGRRWPTLAFVSLRWPSFVHAGCRGPTLATLAVVGLHWPSLAVRWPAWLSWGACIGLSQSNRLSVSPRNVPHGSPTPWVSPFFILFLPLATRLPSVVSSGGGSRITVTNCQ